MTQEHTLIVNSLVLARYLVHNFPETINARDSQVASSIYIN